MKGFMAWVQFSKARMITMCVIAAMLITGSGILTYSLYRSSHTVSYFVVQIGGKEIGTLDNEQQLQDLMERKKAQFKTKYPNANIQIKDVGITMTAAKAFKAVTNAEETLQKLDQQLEVESTGVKLIVDGKVLGILPTEADVSKVLEQLKDQYTPETIAIEALSAKTTKTGGAKADADSKKATKASSEVKVESVEFGEKIDQSKAVVSPDKIVDANTMLAQIQQGMEAVIQYEVREGDTISSIAKRFSISQKDIFKSNPDVKERSMQIGTILNIKATKAPLTVRTVEKLSEEIITAPQVITRKSENMKAGTSKVIDEGSTGLKVMHYRITKDNGEVVGEEWLGQNVITPSKPKIVVQGTKIMGQGTGDFAWPVSGASITSSYGKRWGRMHQGTDIVSSNRTIMAADEGIISFAGTKSGYGNVIIINHQNGYETLYGHLSKIDVKEGQVVEKGGAIGVMGNTGRSTGTHLHFEIHNNGTVENPMKYL
ncbi:M23 family metallopeptidase [Paenibacillus turicensis]|uniref:peptidoglycan DD-metalloendopeptidase family protein n=1 Tax=Paenibacillus turicensis TaxID=160487 RepID=UPI003D2E7BF8